ncbi:MAG: alpha/beta hydrolase-fold protein [Verrucomicrobiota bacterium]
MDTGWLTAKFDSMHLSKVLAIALGLFAGLSFLGAKEPKVFKWINPLTEKELQAAPGLSHQTFKSEAVGEEVGYCVFLTEGYEAAQNRERRYPVIYMLHGGRPGDESKFANRLPFIYDAITSGRLEPTIVVLNNGGPISHYNVPGRADCRGKDLLVDELIPLVDRNYRTIASREGRALQGYSQGGRATARIGFGHPELFSQLVIGSAGAAPEKRIQQSGGTEREGLVFAKGDDMWTYTKTYAKRYKKKYPLDIFVHVGDEADYNYEGNLEYDAFLTELGLEHEFTVVPGQKHGNKAYDRLQQEIIEFQRASFARGL